MTLAHARVVQPTTRRGSGRLTCVQPEAGESNFTFSTFYADERRRSSEERSFGAQWRERGKGNYSVCWLRGTGELALMTATSSGFDLLDGGSPLDLVGVIINPIIDLGFGALANKVAGKQQRAEAQVLAIVLDERDVESLLVGWQDARLLPDGLTWLRERVVRNI